MLIRFEAETRLTTPEAAAALQAATSRQRWFRLPSTPFVGRVRPDGFRLLRVVRGRDSFNPALYGTFVRTEGGTKVKVLVTLHPLVWGFLVLWTGGCVWNLRSSSDWGSIAFLVSPWVLAPIFFSRGWRASREALVRCLHLDTIA